MAVVAQPVVARPVVPHPVVRQVRRRGDGGLDGLVRQDVVRRDVVRLGVRRVAMVAKVVPGEPVVVQVVRVRRDARRVVRDAVRVQDVCQVVSVARLARLAPGVGWDWWGQDAAQEQPVCSRMVYSNQSA